MRMKTHFFPNSLILRQVLKQQRNWFVYISRLYLDNFIWQGSDTLVLANTLLEREDKKLREVFSNLEVDITVAKSVSVTVTKSVTAVS